MTDLNINLLGELAKDPWIFTPQPDVFRVDFSTSNEPLKLRKVHKVAQIVAKVLLTTKGTDSYAPQIGTGIRSLVGRMVSRSNLNNIKRDIALWISDAEKQLLVVQEAYVFPLDERVQDLTLITADFSFTTLTWTIRVRIITEAGADIDIDVGPQLGNFSEDSEGENIKDVLTLDTTPIP